MTQPTSTHKTPTLYFGFGSNIWKQQVKDRCPGSKYLGVARLPGYSWFIAALGGANIRKGSTDDSVWGMVYSLQPKDEEILDVIEKVATKHFSKNIIDAELWEAPGRGTPADTKQETPKKVKVLVYMSHERTRTGRPRDEYVIRMNHAIVDALADGIPEEYIENVLRKWIPPNEEGIGAEGVEDGQ